MRLILVVALVLALAASVHGDLVSSRSQGLGSEPMAIAAADFDKNGVPDAAIVTTLSKAVAVGTTASWEFPISASTRTPVIAADLGGTGYLNYVVVGGNNLYVLDSSGRLLWSANGTRTYSIASTDLNRDNKADIVVGSFGGIRAFDSNGNSLWNYTGIEGSVNYITIADGYIIGAFRNNLIGLDYSGNQLWNAITQYNVIGMTAFDIDDAGSNGGVAVAYSDGEKTYVNAFSKYGEDKKWNYNKYAMAEDLNIFASDRNSRGKRNHVVMCLEGGLYWINNKGTSVGEARLDIFSTKTSCAPIDLDGDGIQDDVIVGIEGSTKARIDVFNAIGGKSIANSTDNGASKLVALDLNGDGKVSEAIGADKLNTYTYWIYVQVTDTTTQTAPPTTTPAPTTPAPTTPTPTTTPPGATTTPSPTTAAPGAQPAVKITASPGASVAEGAVVTLTADATPSAGKSIVSYVWTSEDGKLLGDAKSITWKASKKGTYRITVAVKDSGELRAGDTIVINVGQAAGELTVSAGEDRTVEENTPITLTATAAPSQGEKIISYTWYLDGKKVGDAPSIVLASLPKGANKITVEVVDSAGKKGSADVTITVGSGVLPSLSFGGIIDALLGKLKWVILLVVIIGVVIYLREKILDFLWERQRQWME